MKSINNIIKKLFVIFFVVISFIFLQQFCYNLYNKPQDIKDYIVKEYSKNNFFYFFRQIKNKQRNSNNDISEFLSLWENDFDIPSNFCEKMVPQGLSFANDYILISKYCKCSKKHNSIICVMDKNGKFIKNVILDNKAHAGGITYNNNIDKLVVTGDILNNNESSIYFYNFESVKNASNDDLIQKDYVNTVLLKEASFITYNEEEKETYIGYFSTKNDGILYELNNNYFYDMDNYMQGCQFFEDKIIVSESYGIANSKIVIKDKNNNNIKTIFAPPYLEEIVLDKQNKRLYCLFESGAYPYYFTTNLSINKVIILDFSSIL